MQRLIDQTAGGGGGAHHPKRGNVEDSRAGLDDAARELDEGRSQSDRAAYRPQEHVPERGGGDIARHFDQINSEANLEQTSMRENVIGGRSGVAKINQSVSDEPLSKYAADNRHEKQKRDRTRDGAWRCLNCHAHTLRGSLLNGSS